MSDIQAPPAPPPPAGHNSAGENAARMISYLERIERLTEEKKALQSDIADIFKEIDSAGFNKKIFRMLLRLRAMDAGDRDEQDTLLDLYRRTINL